ncbi:hypothetical protein [Adhaeribacter swui]|nr:hypothetical protein [Adhaeribacter swui]
MAAITVGSTGSQGHSFIPDWQQALPENLLSAFMGGVIFSLANIL